MNTLESCVTTSPYGDEDECAKFTIDDTGSSFLLSAIIQTGQEYTFSCWLKSESSGSLSAGDSAFTSDETWTKRKTTFTADSEDFALVFGVTGTYYIYHAQLEIGNKATDWRPAPEDVDQSISETANELHQYVTEQSTAITNSCEEIILEALQSYTQTGDFESYKETVESQLSLMADQMQLKFTETTTKLEAVNDDLQEKFNSITKYFTFDIDGLTIGQVDNPNKVVIDNDEISILVNDSVVQEFDAFGRAQIPELNITKGLNLFGYQISEDEDGNVNMEYAGGAS